jgi:predicted nuclease of predicted toxin-antitoxin system
MPETDRVSFLADENFDLNIVELLRQEGYFVNSIAEMAPSISDPQVLAIAVKKKAVVLTEEKDFGELVYRLRLAHCGILLIRPMKMDPAEKAMRILDNIRKHINQLPNAFAVLSSDNFRIKSSAKP